MFGDAVFSFISYLKGEILEDLILMLILYCPSSQEQILLLYNDPGCHMTFKWIVHPKRFCHHLLTFIPS